MINGEYTELISIRDRGLQYGDGCFETLLVRMGKPLLLLMHLHRIESTCKFLNIKFDSNALQQELTEFISQCPADGIIKIIITRGIGVRGYSVASSMAPNRILSYSECPDNYPDVGIKGAAIGVCQHRLSGNARLAGLKHLNRLDQVMASMELAGAVYGGLALDEMLCLDQAGWVIEGTKCNLVLTMAGEMITPELSHSGVRGIMLQYLKHRFATSGMVMEERKVSLADVLGASELFLCNSVIGVWPVRKLIDNATVGNWQIGPDTKQAARYFHDLLDAAY